MAGAMYHKIMDGNLRSARTLKMGLSTWQSLKTYFQGNKAAPK